MADQGSTLTDTSAHRERLWPAFLAGLVAGVVGSLAVVILDLSGFPATIATCAVPAFVAAVIAIQFAPTNPLEVSGLFFAGGGAGALLGELVHPTIHGGERNLWPFEVLIYWATTLIPAGVGLLLGRFLAVRRNASHIGAPSNNRWRGP
jgi:hypothetical protein